MPQFNKRGNRIRASDKSLVFCFSAGSLLLLFLTVVMLLNLKTILTTDWKAISLFQDGSVHFTVTPYRIVTVMVSALVCVIAALFYQHFQYDRVKQLFHRQKLAKMRFADKEMEKRCSEWKTNEKWAYFIGSDRGRLKLTTKPEPYTLTRTLNWISRQVAPTWKVLQQIDNTNGTTYLKDILDYAKLTERHKKLIEQQTTSTEEIISKEE